MQTYESIIQRRTIRRFKQDPIQQDDLIKLINGARLAPSGANKQPCEFIIVDHPPLRNALFDTLKWAGYIAPKGNPQEGEHPVAYIVILININRKKKGGEVDAAAAIENILLTAWDMGIGSCWIGSVDRKKVKALLHIPHHFHVDSVVALGYPGENPVLEELSDSVKYWKDGANVLHVPKRKLEDVMHRNGFGGYTYE